MSIDVQPAIDLLRAEDYDAVVVLTTTGDGTWLCWQNGHPLIIDGMVLRMLARRVNAYATIETSGPVSVETRQ